jgi:hypothetical protein
VVTIVLRLVLAPFAHPLFTSLTGIGVGLAVSRPRGAITWYAPLIGFLAAVGLHALWNGSTNFGLVGYLLVYLLVMVPAFVLAIFWARHQRRRERDVVLRQLPAMVYYRWITPMEAGWLGSIAARRAWTKAVAQRSGKAGAQALKAFQNAATELAFLRDRVERNIGPPDAYYLHAELVDALARNRAQAQNTLAQNPSSAPPLRPMPPAYATPPSHRR